ncbi:CD48 antigen-like [Genypterus blacodes]|uniref:CD48 antigen-like n=1 Tax=Genypterus blacodes TaxID=154954 RepID=UPI003F76688C
MEVQMGRKHLAVCISAVLLYCSVWTHEAKLKAREGRDVTLDTRENGHQRDDHVVWSFGPHSPNMRLASRSSKGLKMDFIERFRDRLQLDSQTGSLTITDLNISDSGVYQFQTIGNKIISQSFHLAVYSSVPPPSIKVNRSNGSQLTAECSVKNSQEATLSWFRGSDRLEQIASRDLSATLSLPLVIENHNGENYSCEVENPVDRKTTRLQAEEVGQRNGETTSWCQAETTVRLVVSAAVGVASIVLVVEHFRPWR